MDARKYEFSWDLLGDAKEGRPNLGEMINLKVYRLMQYTFRDVLEKQYGALEADRLFLEAGKLAGTHFFRSALAGAVDFHALTAVLQDAFKGLGVGIFRVEKAEPPYEDILLTVAEDADCSGLPDLEYEYCHYDEGFIEGILESFTGKPYDVKEIDCWCTGDRVCRFHAKARHVGEG